MKNQPEYNETNISNERELFLANLREKLENNPIGAEFGLATLTELEWDRVCSFHEGNPYTFVNERLGGEVFMQRGYIYSQHHLVFTQQGKVILDIPFATKQIYFNIPETESCITREEAIFRIKPREGMEAPYDRFLARVK